MASNVTYQSARGHPPTRRAGIQPPRGPPTNVGTRGTRPGLQGPRALSARLPLTPQSTQPHNQPPYSRPQNLAVSNETGGHTASHTSTSDMVLEICHELLQEVRRGREETKRISDDVKRMGQIMGKLEENYRKLRDDLKEQTEATFSVETSVYKVAIILNEITTLTFGTIILQDGMIRECGLLFAKSLPRQPSKEQIGVSSKKCM